MYYQVTVVIPANTPESAPVITPLTLTQGVISTLRVGFPPGCAGLAHVIIREKGWQICPWSLDESLHWDSYVFEFKPSYPLTSDPYDLTIHAWNLDDSYEHQVFVGAEVEGDELGGKRSVQAILQEAMGIPWSTK
jgi:hypothetical protein